MSADVLPFTEDTYGGVTLDASLEGMSADSFAEALRASLAHFRALAKRGVWLKIPLSSAAAVGPAAAQGFVFHHAEPAYLMMTAWLADVPSTLPANASHYAGVGGLVLRATPGGVDEVLVVREASGPALLRTMFKLPGGLIDVGEEIGAAAVREVLEETGVQTEFVTLAGFRHMHGYVFGKSDLYFVAVLRTTGSTDLVRQESEIAEARWMPVEEFLTRHLESRPLIYSVISHAVAVAQGRAPGISGKLLPHGFRRGEAMVYMANL